MKMIEYSPTMSWPQVVEFAKDLLTRTLGNVSVVKNLEIHVETKFNKNKRFDLAINVGLINDGTFRMAAEVLPVGERRHVKNKIEQLLNFYNDVCGENSIYQIIIAPYISPDSSKICEENNIGYIDFSGNCLLKCSQFYIRVEGNPNKYALKKRKKNYLVRSSLAVSRVLREMLNSPLKFWQVKELAEKADVASGTASNVKQFLIEKDWSVEDKEKFRIERAEALLREWAADYNRAENIAYEYYSIDSVQQLERRIAEMRLSSGITCYLTEFAAAVRYSPTVRYNRISMYVAQSDFEKAVEALELKKVESGGNVRVMIPYDDIVTLYAREINGLFITSPVQTVLDLLPLSGRGEEAAAAIMAKEYAHNA